MSTTTARNDFLARFEDRAGEQARHGPQWLRELRRTGRARFAALGFPTAGNEEWKGTSVTPIAETPFEPGGPVRLAPADLPQLASVLDARHVSVDGRGADELSRTEPLPAGVWVGGLERALAERPVELRRILTRRDGEQLASFAALNALLFVDATLVCIAAGAVVERPIHLVHVASAGAAPRAAFPLTVIVAGDSSQATVVQSYVGVGSGEYLTDAVTEVELGRDAVLDHYRVQLEGERTFHVATTESRQDAASRYRALNVDLGGRLVRHDVRAVLDGEGASCTLDGLYLTGGAQHVDNHTVLDHARPHCDSRELFKGILGGRSRTVFNGRIIVRPDAQKTDAKQSNPNLLLSAKALAHTRPQLEIYADDVKCTHGATIGRLDDDAVFYLRSRAIASAEARRMLVRAFAGEVVDRIRVDALRRFVEGRIDTRLDGVGG